MNAQVRALRASAQTRLSGRQLVLILVAACVLVRLAAMDWLPLMDTTEARYAEIARKMVELGDWVTPWHDYGVPFWGKPPLSFWLTAGSFKLFGVSAFSARLPHFLCMGLVVWAGWGLARRRSPGQAMTLLALLSGAALSFVSAGAVMTDEALVLGITLAMRGFWLAGHDLPSARWREAWWVFIGLAIGLLAKGPLAVVLVALPMLAWLALHKPARAQLMALPWVPGLLVAAGLVAPWYLAAEIRTPGFLSYFIVGEHWHRFVTAGWKGDLYGTAHHFPPGMVWVFALGAMLPWSLSLPVAAWRGRSAGATVLARDADRDWRVYLLCWGLAPLVFFTAARNIIWTYALPALPALALWAASWLDRRLPEARVQRLLSVGLALTLLGCAVAVVQLKRSGDMDRRSAQALVARWAAERHGAEPLVFVGTRLFSASFYSQGRAELVSTPQQAEVRLGGGTGYVALPHGESPLWPAARFLGTFGHYDLVQLRGRDEPRASPELGTPSERAM